MIEENRRSNRGGRARAEPAPARRTRSDSATSEPNPARPAATAAEVDVAVDRDDALYGEFRRQLQTLLSNGPAKPKGIEDALGLVPLQARRWLERLGRDGEIERAFRNPVAYTLTRKSLL